MKNHKDYNIYTVELLRKLNKKTQNLTRAEAIKVWQNELNISERNARRQYVKYVEKNTSLETNDSVEPRKIKRLFWDIETSPNVVLSWNVGYKINLNPENIIKERAIICIGYKWEHESKAKILHWDENQDDKAMLEEFLTIAAEADEMVAHNGDSFDMAWFKTRCIFHGLQPMPDYKTVDTLQWARRKFYFNSNKLDYIASFLGLGCKIKTGFGLWKNIVLLKCPKSLDAMLTYCKKDVELLEQVWARLSKLVTHKTHAGVLNGGEAWQCPKDGSKNVVLNRKKVTAGGNIQYQMRCKDCGSFYTINNSAYQKYLESK